MTSDRAHILVLDGDGELIAALHEALDSKSYYIEVVKACADTLNTLERTRCDLVLLDLDQEGLARIELMKRVRETYPEASVIVATQHPTAASAITAVRYGVHDYLVKPARPEDLAQSVARGVAKARRARREKLLLARLRDLTYLLDLDEPPDMAYATAPTSHNGMSSRHGNGHLQTRDIIIDRHRRRVRRNGKWVNLTPTEFALLSYLVTHAGEVQEYRKLVREVQGYEADEWEARNLIKYYIHCLRKKLEPHPEEPTYILNVRGVGYLFSSPGI
ncbi:MAG: DNA-binding response regulator [Chloroflexi bacterium]|nr:MAG: DNA-binding response regulator [Chloroflexota bacterium]